MRYKENIKLNIEIINKLTGKDFVDKWCNGECSVQERNGTTGSMPYAGWYRKPKEMYRFLEGVIVGLKMNEK